MLDGDDLTGPGSTGACSKETCVGRGCGVPMSRAPGPSDSRPVALADVCCRLAVSVKSSPCLLQPEILSGLSSNSRVPTVRMAVATGLPNIYPRGRDGQAFLRSRSDRISFNAQESVSRRHEIEIITRIPEMQTVMCITNSGCHTCNHYYQSHGNLFLALPVPPSDLNAAIIVLREFA